MELINRLKSGTYNFRAIPSFAPAFHVHLATSYVNMQLVASFQIQRCFFLFFSNQSLLFFSYETEGVHFDQADLPALKDEVC
jgi:hypothetical protein